MDTAYKSARSIVFLRVFIHAVSEFNRTALAATTVFNNWVCIYISVKTVTYTVARDAVEEAAKAVTRFAAKFSNVTKTTTSTAFNAVAHSALATSVAFNNAASAVATLADELAKFSISWSESLHPAIAAKAQATQFSLVAKDAKFVGFSAKSAAVFFPDTPQA